MICYPSLFHRLTTLAIAIGLTALAAPRAARAELAFSPAVQAPSPLNEELPGLGPRFMTADGLTLYHGVSAGNVDMYISARPTVDSPWMPRQEIVEVNAPGFDGLLDWVSPDGLEAYGNRIVDGRQTEIIRTTRATPDQPWSAPVDLPEPLNGIEDDFTPTLTDDGLRMVFGSERPEGPNKDLWEASRASTSSAWTVEKFGSDINTEFDETWPHMTGDGLTLFFGSNRPGGFGNFDIYLSTRESLDAPWSEPVNLGPSINTAGYDNWPVYWEDGGELYILRTDPSIGLPARIFVSQVVPEPATAAIALMTIALGHGRRGRRLA